jgi:hypothetical protein
MKLSDARDVFVAREFVNRKDELDNLLKIASFSANLKASDERVIHVIGKSGVGKSWLMRRFCNILLKEHSRYVLPLYINLQDYAGLTKDDFTVQFLKFVGDKIASELNISFPFQNTNELEEYSGWVLRGIEQVQKQKTFVLLLDEISVLSVDQIEVLEDYFLTHFITLPNTVLILTGRHTVSGWKNFSLRPGVNRNVMELSGFSLYYTQKHIEILNPQANNLVPKIHEISGGSPGNNKKILNQAGGNPLQINELNALRACNQELYDAIAVVGQTLPHDIAAELVPALEALCVLQDFDKEYEMPNILAAHPGLEGVWDVRRSANLLSNLSRIQVGPGKLVDWDKGKSAYAIDEQIRVNLEKQLKIGDKEFWKTLHCTAMKIYAQWAREYKTDFFKAKSKYHKSQLEQAGINLSDCNII